MSAPHDSPSADAVDWRPLVVELQPAPNPADAFRRFAALPHAAFLDSALRHAELGRYSFLAADPYEFQCLNLGDPFLAARDLLPVAAAHMPDLPPFQGGLIGMWGYELGTLGEPVPAARHNEFQLPRSAFGLYDVVLAWDHAADRAWLISQGMPELDPVRRQARAEARLQEFQRWLSAPISARRSSVPGKTISAADLAPQFAAGVRPRLTSNFSADDYLAAVAQAIEYIRAGDIFQVNLAQRLLHPADDDPATLYLRLRQQNPATFAAFFDAGAFQLASASPERFLQVRGRHVETRPIKGTRRRSRWPEADLFAGDELKESEKDRAENVMIVDLLRNDLARVCQADSVQVRHLCRLETYAFVQHLVSVVEGQLRDGLGPWDLLRAAFPGGSITGAPKIRAMQIIAELEPTVRGAYCGAFGYLGFDGRLDTSILIRTITASGGWWQLPVGGGIVADSQPRREWEETWHKAEGLLQALPT